jgi:hypothetical protein
MVVVVPNSQAILVRQQARKTANESTGANAMGGARVRPNSTRTKPKF